MACAVSNHPVGVDVQMIGKYKLNVADRVCNKTELAKIAASDNLAADFTKLWTWKEAYAKWIGEGVGRIVPPAEQMGHVHLTIHSLNDAFLSVVHLQYLESRIVFVSDAYYHELRWYERIQRLCLLLLMSHSEPQKVVLLIDVGN